jgi:hypothetical protein
VATFLEHLITELERRGRSTTKERITLHAERITLLASKLNALERKKVSEGKS